MKNHEGYYDPTAGKAIRKVTAEKKRNLYKKSKLYYVLGELPCFERIYKAKRG